MRYRRNKIFWEDPRNNILWEDSRQRDYRAAKARFRLAAVLAAVLAAIAALALFHL